MDKGLKARRMNLCIKPFTLVGATTRFGLVSGPLRSRFGSIHRLEFYNSETLAMMIQRPCQVFGIEMDDMERRVLTHGPLAH